MIGFRGFIIFTVAASLALAGCGGKEEASSNAAAGKKVFKEKCGICHTLADAGSTGTTGPDLDAAKPDAERVSAQIKSGGGAMSPNIVTGADSKAVSAYVAKVAGKTAPQ